MHHTGRATFPSMKPEATRSADDLVRPDAPGDRPEPGHDAYVREAIAEGLEDIRAGRVTPLEQVWRELGLG